MGPCRLQKADSGSIRQAADRLAEGGLIGMPTETVYGLAASAFDEIALARVFEAKGRPRFDPLIVHVADAQQARSLVTAWPDAAERLVQRFWPGPLTLVLPKRDAVPDLATAGLGTVAIRCPDHPVALALIRELGSPIAAPSANRFGGISPTRAEHVVEELGNSVELVLDAGPCARGVESTVLSLIDRPTLLRPGALTVEAIEAVVGPVARPHHASDNPSGPQISPGQLERHYAPATPMLLYREHPPSQDQMERAAREPQPGTAGYGLLTLGPDPVAEASHAWRHRICLSGTGDRVEAATGLFAALRELDRAGLRLIVAQTPAEQGGLGLAIADRLRRGAARG